MGCEQNAPIQFEEGSNMAARGENPFESHWIYSGSVGSVCGLEYDERRHCVQGELESSVEKAGAVRSGQDPSITESGVPHACIFCSPGNRMAAAGPNLEFMAALFGAILGRSWGSCQKQC